MKSKILIISLGTLCVGTAALFIGCTKNTNPQPPKTDTITTTTTDTLYGSKSDPTVNLARGLLLYLPFNGSTADSSGNNNPTQLYGSGSGLGYDGHGYANSAFTGNGSGPVLLVSNNGSIKFDTAYSISIDFMTADLSTRHAYITMLDWTDGYAPSFEMANSVPAYPDHFDIGVNDTSAGCDNFGTTDPNKLNDTTTFVPQTSRWYNAILTYHKDSIKIYINGSLLDSRVGIGHQAELCPSSTINIGGWWQSDPQYLDGAVDNVRLYNRVLTAHEIAALASNYQPTSNSIKATPKTAR